VPGSARSFTKGNHMTDKENEDFEARQRLLAVFKTSEARKSEDLDIAAAASAIEVPAPRADTAEMEAKLGGQVEVLDVFFAEFARRAVRDFSGFHAGVDLYMKYALKSQAQCSATVAQFTKLRNSRLALARSDGACTERPREANAPAPHSIRPLAAE